eukprot:3617732-Pyramimonas_sp.AAC.1
MTVDVVEPRGSMRRDLLWPGSRHAQFHAHLVRATSHLPICSAAWFAPTLLGIASSEGGASTCHRPSSAQLDPC